MKIGIVCLNLSWQSGGPRLIYSCAQALKRMGHDVVIYSPDFTGEYFKELYQGLDIRVVPPQKPLMWSYRSGSIFDWLWQKFSQERVRTDLNRRLASALPGDLDILNIHDFSYPVAYFYKKRNPKVRVLWTDNDPPFSYLPKGNFLKNILSLVYNAWKSFESKKYFKAIDRVAVLDFYNQKWCNDHGLEATVVRLGVDYEKFFAPVKEDFKERAVKKEIRLFALGSLNQYRHYDDIINAVRILSDWGYKPTLQVIANDMWNEKAYREKLEKLVSNHSLEKSVHLQFQGVSEEGLKEAYKNADVFVYAVYVPAPRNGFGFSIGAMEAIAGGLPLVVCKTTTVTEVLKDRETALIVEPENPESIATQIRWLIDHPEEYKKIGLAGQRYVEKELTWDNYARQNIELFK